jgi:hypothetical protein
MPNHRFRLAEGLVIDLDDLKPGFAERRRSHGLRPNLEMTDEGLVLGAGTLLARPRGGEEPRILALLAAALGRVVSPQILDVMRKALDLWSCGEKFLAQLHLTFARLPPLTEDQAFALFAADELLKSGLSPGALMEGLCLDPAPLDGLEKYDPDQPRVPAGNGRQSGQWGPGSGEAAADGPAVPLIGHGQALSDISSEPAAPTAQVAQEIKCSAFITENCKGSILREFPSEYLDLSVDQVLSDANAGIAAARKAKKLLFSNRFRK